MTELDFLPEWYQVRQERRRSYLSFVLLGASLLGVMSVWFYQRSGHIRQCRGEVQQLQAERSALSEPLREIETLRATRDELSRKGRVADRLCNRPDGIHVLAGLIDLVPGTLVLTELNLITETVKDFTPATIDPTKPSRQVGVGRSIGGLSPGNPSDRKRYLLKLTGMAPDDETVAMFITRLSNSETFKEGLQMGPTRDVKRAGRLMRQFEVTCTLLDHGSWPSAGGRKASSADGAEGWGARALPAGSSSASGTHAVMNSAADMAGPEPPGVPQQAVWRQTFNPVAGDEKETAP